jgi:hypothetical protein
MKDRAPLAGRGRSPVCRVASAAGTGRGAATQPMPDIWKELRQSQWPGAAATTGHERSLRADLILDKTGHLPAPLVSRRDLRR